MRRVTPDAVLYLLSVFNGSDPSCTERAAKSAKQIAATISTFYELPLNKQLTRAVEMHLHNFVRSGHVVVEKTDAGKVYRATTKCFVERHATELILLSYEYLTDDSRRFIMQAEAVMAACGGFILMGVCGYLMLIENYKLLKDAVERYRERGLHPEANRLEARLEQLR
jgi:hypothetical protein